MATKFGGKVTDQGGIQRSDQRSRKGHPWVNQRSVCLEYAVATKIGQENPGSNKRSIC